MRQIAVIGASGLVGSALVERLLARHAGDAVVPFVRSSGNAMRLARRGLHLEMLDLLNGAQVEAALSGATHVVNCSRGDEEVMLGGLANLLAACRRNRVEKLVHLSSVAVYGDPPPPQSERESCAPAAAKGSYGWLKLQQDRMLAKAADEGLRATVLCPPNIAGPHSYFLVSLVDALRTGRFALLEDGSAPCSLVDVSNLAYAIELALDGGPNDGRRMFVTDAECTDWRSVIAHLMPLVQVHQPVPTISRQQVAALDAGGGTRPVSVVRSIAHLVSSDVRAALRQDPLWAKLDTGLRRAVHRMGKPVEDKVRAAVEGPLSPVKVARGVRFDAALCRQQLRGVRHSCALAKERLGYEPLHTTAESMEAFRAWYRYSHGMDTAAWRLIQQLQ